MTFHDFQGRKEEERKKKQEDQFSSSDLFDINSKYHCIYLRSFCASSELIFLSRFCKNDVVICICDSAQKCLLILHKTRLTFVLIIYLAKSVSWIRMCLSWVRENFAAKKCLCWFIVSNIAFFYCFIMWFIFVIFIHI